MALQGTKNGDASSLGTAAPENLKTRKMASVRHLFVTQQTMDPTQDIHRDRWWSQRKPHYFLGVGFLPLACPTLAWKVLRGALSFAFLVAFFGGVSSSLSPSSWETCRFFRGVVLGLSAPSPPPDVLYLVLTI